MSRIPLFPQWKRWTRFALIWLTLAIIGSYFRCYPLRAYTSDEAQEKATVIVLSNLRKTVALAARREFPDRPSAETAHFIQKQFDAILHRDQEKVRRTIDRTAKQIQHQLPHARSYPYLLASDSYYYYGLTDRIRRTGSIAERFRGSKYYNALMLAPHGHWEPLTFHPSLGYYLHLSLSLLNSNLPFMFTLSLTPLFLMILSLIPFIALTRLLRCSTATTLVAGVYLLLAPIYLRRSMFGWYDNDPYNIFFPLLVLSFLFWGIRYHRQRNHVVTGFVLAALSLCLYALFWQGWVFLASVLASSFTILLPLLRVWGGKPATTRRLIKACGLCSLVLLCGISTIFGIREFLVLFREGAHALKGFLHPSLDLWPDLYIGVGELHRISLQEILNLTGGIVFWIIAAIGFCIEGWRSWRRQEPIRFLLPGILFLFLLLATGMSMGAQRFALLCLVPLSLLFAVGVEHLFAAVRQFLLHYAPSASQRTWRTRLAVGLLSLGFIAWPVRQATRTTPTLINRLYTDTWHDAMVYLREKTPPDSIVNSWWPPGHFITAMAQRRVTFDGATINTPQAYWMANVFLSTREEQAAGILRMLHSSGNDAVTYLQQCGLQTSEAVALLKDITPLTADKARLRLNNQFLPEQTEHLLRLTHRRPPPSYIMLYNDLVEKNIQLTFVGNWDFRKVEHIKNSPELRRDIPQPGDQNYVSFLWDMAGGRPRFSVTMTALSEEGAVLTFPEGIRIDRLNQTCRIDSAKFGRGTPRSLVLEHNGRILTKEFPDGNLSYSALLFHQGSSYKCILLDEALAHSLLVRMYYFEGKGLRYFTPVFETRNLSGRTHIRIFRVRWDNFSGDLHDES